MYIAYTCQSPWNSPKFDPPYCKAANAQRSRAFRTGTLDSHLAQCRSLQSLQYYSLGCFLILCTTYPKTLFIFKGPNIRACSNRVVPFRDPLVQIGAGTLGLAFVTGLSHLQILHKP